MELSRRSFICAALVAAGTLPLAANASEKADASAASERQDATEAPAAGSVEAAAQLMADLDGTYENLWDVLAQYPDAWHDSCAAIVGEADANATAEMLQASCTGTLTGQDAVDAYEADPDSAAFDCSFPDGVVTLTFDGGEVSGQGEDGKDVFKHAYEYLCYAPSLDFYVFQTADEDAGEYRYFVSRSDTPASTYHLEMRFGSDLNDLLQFTSGAYAYAMPSAISVDADEDTIDACIDLFVTENLEG